jgi:hypothetical protein
MTLKSKFMSLVHKILALPALFTLCLGISACAATSPDVNPEDPAASVELQENSSADIGVLAGQNQP